MTDDSSVSSQIKLSGGVRTISSSTSTRTIEKHSSDSQYLAPPNRLLRRKSNESLFSGSDISELSFGSTEDDNDHQEGLVRTLSNVSSTLANFPAPRSWRSKLQHFWIANYGAFLVLLSQMFGCMMIVATRILETPGSHGKPMHPFQILFVRQSVTVFITMIYALWSKSVPHFPFGPPGKIRLLLVSRGVCGSIGVLGLYFSLLYLPLSEATILTFLTPIGSCYAFALLLPDESFSKQQQLAGLVSLIGVVFIARPASLFRTSHVDNGIGDQQPALGVNTTLSSREVSEIPHPTPTQHLQAVGIAMMGVVGAIGAMTSIRAIGQRAHALLSVNYFSAWCTFISLIALAVIPSVNFRLPANALEWGLLVVLGSAGFVMQLLLTLGMAYGGASNSEKENQPSRQEDIELQNHTIEPQEAPSAANVSETSRQEQIKVGSGPSIKASGAKATSMLYTQMLFALTADKVIFGVTPGVWSWIGSGLIMFGAIWVAADSGAKKSTTVLDTDRHERAQEVSPSRHGDSIHEEVGLLTDVDGAENLRSDEQGIDAGGGVDVFTMGSSSGTH